MKDPCLAFAPIQTRNYVLACFIVHLIQGNTINSIFVKSKTLKGYVKAVINLHLERNLPNPTKVRGSSDLVDPLISSIKSYESVPNRREMIYDNMFNLMLKTIGLYSEDSLERSILDWIILGRVTGARKSEWCQDSQSIALTQPSIHHVPLQPLAFILDDFTFHSPNQHILHITPDIDTSTIATVIIKWRYQKNNNNGEKIPFTRDWKRPHICPVLAAYRIIRRAQRLRLPPDSPLATYSKNTSYAYITATQVTSYLRTFAKSAFGLKDNDPQLDKWSCHSIRVTAANLLHRAKMSDSYIQTRLRWKSTAFLDYLRNTIYTAQLHTDALAISPLHLPHLSTADTRHRPSSSMEQFLESNRR